VGFPAAPAAASGRHMAWPICGMHAHALPIRIEQHAPKTPSPSIPDLPSCPGMPLQQKLIMTYHLYVYRTFRKHCYAAQL
jgi:hypothetical protein